jgi:hypothetical protein
MLDNVIQDVASLTTRMYTMLVTHTNLFLSHPPTWGRLCKDCY